MKVVVIPADINLSVYEQGRAGDTDILKFLQETVEGYIERVQVGNWITRERADGTIMIVNEEGRIRDLDVNPRASILYGAPLHHWYIYGTAVIVGERYGAEGVEFCDLPEDKGVSYWMDLLRELLRPNTARRAAD